MAGEFDVLLFICKRFYVMLGALSLTQETQTSARSVDLTDVERLAHKIVP